MDNCDKKSLHRIDILCKVLKHVPRNSRKTMMALVDEEAEL